MVLVGQAVSPANLLPMSEYRRRLPHFHPDDADLFLTWRLLGSLPSKPSSHPYPTPGQAFAAADRALHRNRSGPLWLKEPRIAKLVVETIVAGERERGFYELSAWVVMPNHVHLLILPRVAVPEITRWLKGSTARRANQLLGRTGLPFWQDESYDHWVRNTKEFDRITGYIEENPVTAGLVVSMELWPWSSAAWQAKPPAPPDSHLPSAISPSGGNI
jgi:REP element-mobilizing transposase RayT